MSRHQNNRRHRTSCVTFKPVVEIMKSFIASTFLFLFVGFYALSGGPNFTPPEVSPFLDERQALAIPQAPEPFAAYKPETPKTKTGTPGLVLASFSAEASANSAASSQITAAGGDATLVSAQKASLTASAAPEVVSKSKTDMTGISGFENTQDTAAKIDLRVVTASRVNLRNGPGTRFDVIDQLSRNEEVQVLRSGDTGWVRLRTPDGRVGWMAERLLTAKTG